MMQDFITLSCPSCGGKLQVTNDINRFACGHCGMEHIVKRGGGIVALIPVIENIKHIQVGVDKTASELAIIRLSEEILALERERVGISTFNNNGIAFRWIFFGLLVGVTSMFVTVPLFLIFGLYSFGYGFGGFVAIIIFLGGSIIGMKKKWKNLLQC